MDYSEIRYRLETQVKALDEIWNKKYNKMSMEEAGSLIRTAVEALKALSMLPGERIEVQPEKGYPKGQTPTLTVVDEINPLPNFSAEREAMLDLYGEILETYHEVFGYHNDELHVDDARSEEYRADLNRIFGIMFKYGSRDK